MECSKMTDNFYSVLKKCFKEQNIDSSLIDVFIEEDVTKEIFMKLSIEEIGHLFPSLKFGMKKKILLVRDELKEKEDAGDSIYDNSCLNFEERVEEPLSEKFIETFRGFNCAVRD